MSKKASESKQMATELSSAAKSLTAKLADTKDRLDDKEKIAATDSVSALAVSFCSMTIEIVVTPRSNTTKEKNAIFGGIIGLQIS